MGLAACWVFAGSLAWLFIGFCGVCAQLNKRMLVPSRVCTKHLRGSLNEQPQPCSASCQLPWAAPGEGKAKSLPAKESGENCLINNLIGNFLLFLNFIWRLLTQITTLPGWYHPATTDYHSVLARGVAATCPELGHGSSPCPAQDQPWGQP